MSILYNSKNDIEYLVTDVPNNSLLNSLGIFRGSKIIKKRTFKNGGKIYTIFLPLHLVVDA